MGRLRWNGSLEAARQAQSAKVNRPKRKHRRKRKKKSTPNGKSYLRYLKTEWWKKRRVIALKKANWQCEECGSAIALEVHHLSYARLFHELDADLIVLCYSCHRKKHPNKQ